MHLSLQKISLPEARIRRPPWRRWVRNEGQGRERLGPPETVAFHS